MGKLPVDLTKSEYLRWEQIGGDEVHGGSNGVGDGVTDDDRKIWTLCFCPREKELVNW